MPIPTSRKESTMAAIRRAEATWSGALTTGSGSVSGVSSGTFTDLPVTWAARTETSDGKTSPEELVAAAHAACFSMALSGALNRAGKVPGMSAADFEAAAQATKDGCPVSVALAGNVALSVEATLEG
jgi:osmotically inducible protein OsmC